MLSKKGTPPPIALAQASNFTKSLDNSIPDRPNPIRRNPNSHPPPAQVKAVRLSPNKITSKYQPKYEDFKVLKVLGQGSFGKVLLAQWKKGSDKPVAIKILRKDATIDNNDVTATIVERDILVLGSEKKGCTFLAGLVCCFQDPDRLFFVMEFLSGGDLMFHVQKKSRFRTHEARFYACQIACALELDLGFLYNHVANFNHRLRATFLFNKNLLCHTSTATK